ncbi:MAG TPA: methyltransferase domain-containing protein [Methylomirabilota bacterium]|nr:methyltransferase domain-containing protein [Methylomirabilota bacterium]
MTERRRHHGHAHHGRYGNPKDLDAYLARQLDPARATWQKPDAALRAMGLSKGQTVAEIGAGPGFWTLRIARMVGPSGHVYAVDPEPAILEVLRQRLEKRRVKNVTPVLGGAGDPLLPAHRSDLALIVNTYHHFPDGLALLRRVAAALRSGGRLVNIDFHKRETPVGPPVGHRVAREEFLLDARRAGFTLVAEHRFLPYQYFLVFRRGR